jgi:hypothetical protein
MEAIPIETKEHLASAQITDDILRACLQRLFTGNVD